MSKKTKCKYCGEAVNIYMAMSEGRFCSWGCYELFEEQEKAREVDILKDRYSEGEIKSKGESVKQ